jgi:tRNA(Ile)-lysidine synthase
MNRLAEAFPRHFRELGGPDEGATVVVAVSGGVDSLVLLHLLRHSPAVPRMDVRVAHFDHRMRPGSREDGQWVAGVARAWALPVEIGRAETRPEGEQAAREARYRFLTDLRQGVDAQWILTAHHADDQAETVLFRIFRGTGIRGLAGIPVRREPGILRPLLPFWKSQILDYAGEVGLEPRIDPTNRDPSFARNRIRHDVIPSLEAGAAPRLRRSLTRLARLARQNESAWSHVIPDLLARLDATEREGRISVDLAGLLRYDSSVQARLLRALARRLGSRLDEAGTQAALDFSAAAGSGREAQLPGGLAVAREFDRLVMTRPAEAGENRPLEVPGCGPGSGAFVIGGRRFEALWSDREAVQGRWVERFDAGELAFPLRFREWRPGDRIRMPYGGKKLKKLFVEARVPKGERDRRPVLQDAAGRVLWVPGIARSTWAPARGHAYSIAVWIADDTHVR